MAATFASGATSIQRFAPSLEQSPARLDAVLHYLARPRGFGIAFGCSPLAPIEDRTMRSAAQAIANLPALPAGGVVMVVRA